MVFPLLHETTAEASQEDHRCPPACDPTGIDWWTEIPISKDSNSPSCLAVPVVGVPFLAQSHSTAKTTNGMHNKGSACASLVSMPPRPGKHHQGAIGVVQGTMHPVVALP
ncbi:uncharacterized protein CLUP02_08743 [Colletotrichum lupini]|uniref:Uncharacterized protein n=1 Tax=Colletotrichum lupini TaxID=145971 RepID=A0A9Q8STC9_9PEZI|nr:uncharacterized protein CLUP02_08743 [Colletotrichum lupini]UQC83249.1 hypothetical protein CLUP02_08743 [Colletotrichum lupini]